MAQLWYVFNEAMEYTGEVKAKTLAEATGKAMKNWHWKWYVGFLVRAKDFKSV